MSPYSSSSKKEISNLLRRTPCRLDNLIFIIINFACHHVECVRGRYLLSEGHSWSRFIHMTLSRFIPYDTTNQDCFLSKIDATVGLFVYQTLLEDFRNFPKIPKHILIRHLQFTLVFYPIRVSGPRDFRNSTLKIQCTLRIFTHKNNRLKDHSLL